MQFEKKTALIKGYPVSYLDINPDRKEAILFVHGNSSSKRCFFPLFEYLKDYRLIAFDLFGHGESPRVTDHSLYTVPLFCLQTRDMADHLSLHDFVLAGHSFGGHIAIETIPLMEERLRRVVAWGTPPVHTSEDIKKAFLPNPDIAPMFRACGSEKELAVLAESFIFNRAFRRTFIEDYVITDPSVRPSIFEGVARGTNRDEIEVIEKSSVPITLIHAEKDSAVNSDYLWKVYRRARRKNPRLTLEIVDTSHSAQIDAPEAIAEILRDSAAQS